MKVFAGLLFVGGLILFLSIDEDYNYWISSSLVSVWFLYYALWNTPKNAHSKPKFKRLINALFNIVIGAFLTFLNYDHVIEDYYFVNHGALSQAVVTEVVKDTCRVGLRKRRQRNEDCWRIAVKWSGGVARETTFTEHEYNIGDKVWVVSVKYPGLRGQRVKSRIFQKPVDPSELYKETYIGFARTMMIWSVGMVLLGIVWIITLFVPYNPEIPILRNQKIEPAIMPKEEPTIGSIPDIEEVHVNKNQSRNTEKSIRKPLSKSIPGIVWIIALISIVLAGYLYYDSGLTLDEFLSGEIAINPLSISQSKKNEVKDPAAETLIEFNKAIAEEFSSIQRQELRAVQSTLKKLGYYTQTVDGLWGKNTNQAIAEYAMAKSLNPDRNTIIQSLKIGSGTTLFTGTNKNQKTLTETQKKVLEGFKKGAIEINKKTPIMIDQKTRMDKATTGPGTLITYYFTFPEHSSREIDPAVLRQELRPTVKNKLCNSKDMKLSLQLGGSYAYSYSGNDGIQVLRFTLDRSDCGYNKITP